MQPQPSQSYITPNHLPAAILCFELLFFVLRKSFFFADGLQRQCTDCTCAREVN